MRCILVGVGAMLAAAAVVPSCAGRAGPAAVARAEQARASTTSRPNIVLILTDDQRADSMLAMPNVRRELGSRGITFTRAFVSNSLCCPSRAAILTGAYSHTDHIYTNVYTSWSPYGAWPLFHDTGGERHTIAVALHRAGYRTALFGKYLNDFAGSRAPPGWDRWAAFLAQGDGGAYYDYTMLDDGPRGPRPEVHGDRPWDYSTTVIRRKSLAFLRSTPAASPFFLYVAPYGPHGPSIPAPRDLGSWAGSHHPLPPSFDEPVRPGQPAYIRNSAGMSAATAEERFQHQSESLASIDRMVDAIVAELRRTGRLHHTLFVFMSDNGVANGDHRWTYKMTPYEETIHVPMIVRFDPLTGPRAGSRSGAMVANIDVAPTIARIAGVPFTGVGTIDGRSMLPVLAGKSRRVRDALLLEHIDFPGLLHVPSYCGLRVKGWMFTRYQTGEQELYSLGRDPYELQNVVKRRPWVAAQMRAETKRLCSPLPPGYTWP